MNGLKTVKWALVAIGLVLTFGIPKIPFEIRIAIVLGIFAIFFLPGIVFSSSRRRKAKEVSGATDSCVACGAKELERAAANYVCLQCGFEGRLDGGGALSKYESKAVG